MSVSVSVSPRVREVLEYIQKVRENPPFSLGQYLQNFNFRVSVDGISLSNNNTTQAFPFETKFAINLRLKDFPLSDDEVKQLREVLMSMQYDTESNIGYYENVGFLFKIAEGEYVGEFNGKYYDVKVKEYVNVRLFAMASVALTFIVIQTEQEEDEDYEDEEYEEEW